MALNVDKVFKFVQFVSNKESRGWIAPAEFNIAAELAQIAVYSKYESMFLANKKVHSYMRPFLRMSDETIASGVIPFPTSFRQLIGGRITSSSARVNELTQSEISDALESTIINPTSSYPAVVVRNDGIYIYPTSLTGDVTLEFIAGLDSSNPPEWGYTTVSSRPVYSSGASQDFEFGDEVFMEIASNILMHVGLNLGEDNVTQYGVAFNSQQ